MGFGDGNTKKTIHTTDCCTTGIRQSEVNDNVYGCATCVTYYQAFCLHRPSPFVQAQPSPEMVVVDGGGVAPVFYRKCPARFFLEQQLPTPPLRLPLWREKIRCSHIHLLDHQQMCSSPSSLFSSSIFLRNWLLSKLVSPWTCHHKNGENDSVSFSLDSLIPYRLCREKVKFFPGHDVPPVQPPCPSPCHLLSSESLPTTIPCPRMETRHLVRTKQGATTRETFFSLRIPSPPSRVVAPLSGSIGTGGDWAYGWDQGSPGYPQPSTHHHYHCESITIGGSHDGQNPYSLESDLTRHYPSSEQHYPIFTSWERTVSDPLLTASHGFIDNSLLSGSRSTPPKNTIVCSGSLRSGCKGVEETAGEQPFFPPLIFPPRPETYQNRS